MELYKEYHTIFLNLFYCLYIIRWYIHIMSIAISFGLMSNRNILKNCQHLRRIVFRLKWNAHVDHLYVKCKYLWYKFFSDRLFMFKAVNGLLPLHLNNLFITNNNIRSHCIRQHCYLHVLRHNTSIRASSIRICGVKIWNCLDNIYI